MTDLPTVPARTPSRSPAGNQAAEPCNSVFLISHEKKLSLVREHGWVDTGHWNNWFHPVTRWNYDLHDAVVNILSKTKSPK